MTDTESEGQRTVRAQLRSLERIYEKCSKGEYSVEPASALALDHERLPTLRVKDSVDRALHHSLDNVLGINQVLFAGGGLQHYAPFTMVRAALETAATAVWLLQPPNRETRLERRAAIEFNDNKESEAALRAAGVSDLTSTDRRRTLANKVLVSSSINAKKCKWPMYSGIIQEVDPDKGTQLSAELAWRACSGMAHGKFWAFQMLTDRQNVRTSEDGLMQAEFAPSWHSLAIVLGVTGVMIKMADRLYDERRTAFMLLANR